MFVGTPCQVKGLQKYVGGKYRNSILAVSLVCHGVSSPAAFKKYVEEMKSTIHGDVQRVVFRDKVEGRPDNVPSYTTLEYADGYKDSQALNPYTTAFGLGLMQRPSCSVCPFTTVKRDCDITIGDFWGIEDQQSDMAAELRNGISLILAHSDLGKTVVSELRDFNIDEKPLEWAINSKQPQLSHPHEKNPRRDRFLDAAVKENKLFVKKAEGEILRWRIVKKINKIVRG
jgi:coenzyme F420-reducing hydrogenase beta subunit